MSKSAGGPHADRQSGHFGGGANFDDDHVPAPSDHAPATYEFQVGEGEGLWFVVGEGEDLDECMASQAWIESDSTVEVRQ